MPSSSSVTVGADIFYKAVHGPAVVACDSKPRPGRTEVGECKCVGGARVAQGVSDQWGDLVRTPFRKQATKHEKTPHMACGHQCLTGRVVHCSLLYLYLCRLGHCLTVSLTCTPSFVCIALTPRALERETKELWAGVWRTGLQFPVHSDFKCALQLIRLSKRGLGDERL